jgi:Secretion system C-terminal sorting domain
MHKVFVLIFIFFLKTGYSQRIIDFNLYPANNSVTVKFKVAKGNSCNQYYVLHSLDSLYFNRIYDFAGICGDASSDIQNSWTHTNPALNQTNYYKIDLPPFETSGIRRIYVVAQQTVTIKAYPNPVGSNENLVSLKVDNLGNVKLVGFLYNQFGKPIRQFNVVSYSDITKVDVGDLHNGLYIIWLTDGEKPYAAKILINR